MKRLLFFCALLLLAVVPCSSQQPAASKSGSNANSAAKPKAKLTDADLSGFDLSDDKSRKVISSSGGTRGVDIPSATLLAPKIARLYGASALFQWAPIGPTDGYIFTIVDDDETQLVRQQSKDPSFELSGGLGKLKPGESYTWRVQALPRNVPGEGLKVVVVSAAERRQIDKELAAIPGGDPYDTGLARARVFVKYHLWFDAIGGYTDLIEKFPDRAQPYEDRGAIYAKIDVTHKRGEADLAKAANLK